MESEAIGRRGTRLFKNQTVIDGGMLGETKAKKKLGKNENRKKYEGDGKCRTDSESNVIPLLCVCPVCGIFTFLLLMIPGRRLLIRL